MKHNYSIKVDSQIELKALRVEDIENLRLLRNKGEIRENFIYNNIIEKDEQLEWFKKYINNSRDIMWSIYLKEKWCGVVAIYDINLITKQAEFGRIMIDPNVQGNGVGEKVLDSIIHFSKDVMQLRKLILTVKKNNKNALNLYIKKHFVKVSEKEKLLFMELLLMKKFK